MIERPTDHSSSSSSSSNNNNNNGDGDGDGDGDVNISVYRPMTGGSRSGNNTMPGTSQSRASSSP